MSHAKKKDHTTKKPNKSKSLYVTEVGRGTNVRGQVLKIIRGQGPTFQGQTLSRPRTEMVEAKDQVHMHFFQIMVGKFS